MKLRGEERAPVLDSVCGVLALGQDDSVWKSGLRPWFRLTGAGATQPLLSGNVPPFSSATPPLKGMQGTLGLAEHRRIIMDILHP